MGEPLPYLRTALERLEQASLAPALASLLHAWRASDGAPAIADAIDRLSDTLTRNEPIIRASGRTTMKEAWYAALRSRRPAALGRLLEALPEGSDRVARLRALMAEPPDPRVGTFARRWIESPPPGRGRAAFLAAVAKLLEHTGDARVTPTSVPALGDEARQVLERIDAILRQPARATSTADTAALLEQIYDDPADDEPRAVLADLLQQHGDPRGVFIALQLGRYGTTQGPSLEEKKLEATWGRTWLGGMEPIVAKNGVVFERGFVARCRYAARIRASEAFDAPEWATVTHVDVSDARTPAPFLLSPAARNFRHVVGLSVTEIGALAKARALPWETVGFRGPLEEGAGELFAAANALVLDATGMYGNTEERDAIARLLGRWPNVRSLEIWLESANPLPALAERLDDRVTRVTVRSRTATAGFDRAANAIWIDMHRVSEYELSNVRHLIEWSHAKRAHVRVPLGTFDGERLRFGIDVARTAPLEDMARRLGIALTIQDVRI